MADVGAATTAVRMTTPRNDAVDALCPGMCPPVDATRYTRVEAPSSEEFLKFWSELT
jgi:hypothetical protein